MRANHSVDRRQISQVCAYRIGIARRCFPTAESRGMNASLRAYFADAEAQGFCTLFEPGDYLLLIHKC